MNKDKVEISLNQEDVQNIIDCYEKDIKYIERLEKENAELKERLERIENYLDKNYAMENQYWFDHIQDIVKDR